MAQAPEVEIPQSSAQPLISADRVRGTAVFSRDGERLGRVEDVMLHKATGRVAYAVLAFGGLLGVGERFHPLPWSLLRYDPDLNGYVAPLDREQLQAGPAMERGEFDDNDEAWRERIHAHYAAPPYWF